MAVCKLNFADTVVNCKCLEVQEFINAIEGVLGCDALNLMKMVCW